MSQQKSTYNKFVGIDVGKFGLDLAFHDNNQCFKFNNNKEGYRLLWETLKKELIGALVIVETTGWYERNIINFLIKKGVAVHRAQARKVRMFIASYGGIAKTDSLDAKNLALYGKERVEHLTEYKMPNQIQEKLQLLYGRILDLKRMLVQEKNRIQSPGYKDIREYITPVIRTLENQIDKVEKEIKDIVFNNPILLKKYNILITVDGVGELTALALIAYMPELGSINKKQAASLGGLAPHPKDSGIHKGYRRTTGGRSEVKALLHMAALGAIRKNTSKLKQFYNHLINDNKKKPLVALTAVKRKILVIANARLAEQFS